MAKLLYKLGRFAATKPGTVIAAWLVALILATVSFIAFRGDLNSTITIPGTETAAVTAKLKKQLPDAAGGSAMIVLKQNSEQFTADQKQQITDLAAEITALKTVKQLIDPFATVEILTQKREQLEAGAAQLAAQETQLKNAALQVQQAKDYNLPNAAELEKQLREGEQKLLEAKAQLATGRQLLEMSEQANMVSADKTVAVLTVIFDQEITKVTAKDREKVVQLVDASLKAHSNQLSAFYSNELVLEVPEILGIGEIIGAIIAFLVLLGMLRAIVPATVPILVAVSGVVIAVFAALSLSGKIAMMSITPTLGVMLGLAVGIDYALFILNKHRIQLLAKTELVDSIAYATGTSGSAVVFAGSTVVVALLGLNVTGIPFLATMGTVAAFAVLVAVLCAITLTPALLKLAGMRVLNKKARKQLAEAGIQDPPENSQKTVATPKNNRLKAWITVLLAVISLTVIALPAQHMRLGLATAASEDPKSTQHQAYQLLTEHFGAGANAQLLVVAEPEKPAKSEPELFAQQLRLAKIFNGLENVVATVPVFTSDDNKTLAFRVQPVADANAKSTAELVENLRSLNPEAKIGVAGFTSGAIDIAAKLAEALPRYLTLVVGISFVILVLVFRSLLVPLIATAGFVLTLFAAYGALTAIYQDGFLGEIFGVSSPQPILAFLPTIVLGILFGLAMDYQLFITSAIREAYVHGMPADRAVSFGVRQSRAVVIAAALIMISVFAGFIFSHAIMIRPIGFALAFGVLVDAFVIRLLLIPAILQLLGKWAWWLPKWVDRLLPNLDVEGANLERKDKR